MFLDIMHSYNGYHTCYYRTFICGQPNKHQIEAYDLCSKWVSDSIDIIRPGVTVDEVASVWPAASEFGYKDEEEAFLLQYGHGIGLSLWSARSSRGDTAARTRCSGKAWCSPWSLERRRRRIRRCTH